MAYEEQSFKQFLSISVASGNAGANNPNQMSMATAAAVGYIAPMSQPIVVRGFQVMTTEAIHATNPVFALRHATTFSAAGAATGSNKCTITLPSGAAAVRVYENHSFTPFKVKPGQLLVCYVATANGAAAEFAAGVFYNIAPEAVANCTQVTVVTG